MPENQLPQALSNLLKVTHHHLLIAVLQEQQPEVAYRHQQVFLPEKLERWGTWCIDQRDGKGRYWCEEVMGEMLIVELTNEEK